MDEPQNPQQPDISAPPPAPETDLSLDRQALSGRIGRLLHEDRWSRFRLWIDLPLLVVFVVAMTAILAPPRQGHLSVPAVGSVANHTIRAQRNLLIEDKIAMTRRQQQGRAEVRDIFDYDPEHFLAIGEKVRQAISTMVQQREAGTLSLSQRRDAFAANLGAPIGAGIYEIIEKMKEPVDVAVAIRFFLNLGLDRMVIADHRDLPANTAIEVRNTAMGTNFALESNDRILDLRSLHRRMGAMSANAPYGGARIIRSWVLETARALASGNLKANAVATEKLRQAAEAAVAPIFIRILAGEVLLRPGDRVTEVARERIELLNKQAGGRLIWAETGAVAALLSGIIILGFAFFRFGRAALSFGRKRAYLALGAFAGTALVCVAFYYAGLGIADGLEFDQRLAAYFAPLCLATVVISLLLEARTSLLVGIALSLFVTYRVGGDLWLVTYYMVGVLAAGIAARTSRRRMDLLRIGFVVSGAQAALAPIIVVLAGFDFNDYLLPLVGAALVSGIFVGLSSLGLLPLLEQLFDETTDLRLLELASADNPILKEMAVASPGTYHHSVMVGNLAEAAAEGIGLSGLRCRVMALYHDIGKMRRPNYFSENQRDGENLHERLQPEASARILLAHVHDGLEQAAKAGLGRAILEGIAQHHGSALMRSIYERARHSSSGNAVREEDFRYPGPKPSTPETGILMLADTTEAATRALDRPTPNELRKRIRQIMEHIVADGQLDDCALTLRDLAEIEAAFTRVLTLGVYHNRIEYPPLPRAAHRGEETAGETQSSNNGENHDAADRPVRFLRGLADRSS